MNTIDRYTRGFPLLLCALLGILLCVCSLSFPTKPNADAALTLSITMLIFVVWMRVDHARNTRYYPIR